MAKNINVVSGTLLQSDTSIPISALKPVNGIKTVIAYNTSINSTNNFPINFGSSKIQDAEFTENIASAKRIDDDGSEGSNSNNSSDTQGEWSNGDSTHLSANNSDKQIFTLNQIVNLTGKILDNLTVEGDLNGKPNLNTASLGKKFPQNSVEIKVTTPIMLSNIQEQTAKIRKELAKNTELDAEFIIAEFSPDELKNIQILTTGEDIVFADNNTPRLKPTDIEVTNSRSGRVSKASLAKNKAIEKESYITNKIMDDIKRDTEKSEKDSRQQQYETAKEYKDNVSSKEIPDILTSSTLAESQEQDTGSKQGIQVVTDQTINSGSQQDSNNMEGRALGRSLGKEQEEIQAQHSDDQEDNGKNHQAIQETGQDNQSFLESIIATITKSTKVEEEEVGRTIKEEEFGGKTTWVETIEIMRTTTTTITSSGLGR